MRNRALRCKSQSGLLLALVLAASSPSWAQSPSPSAPFSGTEVTLAETLYREGRQLMSEQRYEEACAKFSESNRLDPATGSLLNLAACLEASGKPASAWVVFGEALRSARREERRDRMEFAERRLALLEPRLSHLTVTVAGSGKGMVVKVDGVVIGPAAYGVASPIDPGAHRVEASAVGYKPWSRDVTIGESAVRERVAVPELEADSSSASAMRAEPAPRRPAPLEPPPLTSRPIPTGAYVSGGAAVLFTAGAIVSGVAYLNLRNDDTAKPLGDRTDAYHSARVAGWLNAGLSAAALLSASITIYVVLARPEATSGAPQSAVLRPYVGRDRLGLSLGSEF